jgi:hypothetical protein
MLFLIRWPGQCDVRFVMVSASDHRLLVMSHSRWSPERSGYSCKISLVIMGVVMDGVKRSCWRLHSSSIGKIRWSPGVEDTLRLLLSRTRVSRRLSHQSHGPDHDFLARQLPIAASTSRSSGLYLSAPLLFVHARHRSSTIRPPQLHIFHSLGTPLIPQPLTYQRHSLVYRHHPLVGHSNILPQ